MGTLILTILGFLRHYLFLFLRVSGGGTFPPPLSAEQERQYFRRMRQGDASARDCLIEHNLRLVAHIIKKYYGSCRNQDDLMSIGTIGLIKAIDTFNSENGARFATYASKCLQNEILMYFRCQKKLTGEVSLSETIDVDRDGNPLTYLDVICSEDTIADDLDLKLKSTRALRLIREELCDRERKIMIMRYGLGTEAPLTQRETAAALGISRSYVSRLEKSALEKLRRALTERTWLS